jgi:hypothetical protein
MIGPSAEREETADLLPLDEGTAEGVALRWGRLRQKQKTQNRLSRKSYRLHHIRDHPVHVEHKVAANQFKNVMEETRRQDWTDWLESAMQQDLYIANKYITNEPSDYSSAHVPALKTTFNNIPGMAEDNVAKAKALADSFFPPLPTTSRVPLDATCPTPLKGIRRFSRARIRQVVWSLSPYKAPGPDKIPNVVLIKCCDALINHLYFIFKAVFELNTYHPRWLESVIRMPRHHSYIFAILLQFYSIFIRFF